MAFAHLYRDTFGQIFLQMPLSELENFVLVGHSFAGKVAAAAADRIADKIRMILYLDGFSPEKVRTPQGSFPDEFPVSGSTVPFPKQFLDAVGKDVQGSDLDWLTAEPELYRAVAVLLAGGRKAPDPA